MKRLFVANRGEIAIRVIRSAHELGIETVLAVSNADSESLGARLSDEIAHLGSSHASKSYLSRKTVLDAAVASGADAVHPGYGFLSEDAEFAGLVHDAGMIWVGPSPESINLMGNKAAAREAARAAGVPIMQGSDGVIANADELVSVADKLGFPLLIKASAGGGGRGIRIVRHRDELLTEHKVASAEASAAFGDSAVYLERFIDRARHVEVQILGDGRNAVHLFDRDCSMQRRQQKVVEEAPATKIPKDLRAQMLTSAVELAKACNYKGAGTVEYLYDSAKHEVAFIEMNTRLQVEHPISECITGIDLVREQLRIAAGEPLRFTQEDISVRGHAIEMRINAENPDMNFMPSPGTLESVTWPMGPGVRVDTGFAAGSTVPPYYDSLLAKVIVWDEDRDASIRRAQRVLSELDVQGVHTTSALIGRLLETSEFAAFDHHTKFIEEFLQL